MYHFSAVWLYILGVTTNLTVVKLSPQNSTSVCVVVRDALNDIFDMCDLTSNELWSREEFRLFNLLTSDQELDDAEWRVVEGLSVFSRHLQ